MAKVYRLVVFDWEGTLADSLGKILKVLQVEAHKMGLGDVDERLARQYLMFGLMVAIKKIFPDLSAQQYETLIQATRESLALRSMDVYLIPGAQNLIDTLKRSGMMMAIATNKGQHSLQRDLQSLGIENFFMTTRSAGQSAPKPSPEMLEAIMDDCNVSPEETLMIGDSLADVEMARTANVDAIGVNFYNQLEQMDELRGLGALDVFDDFQQLHLFLNLKPGQ